MPPDGERLWQRTIPTMLVQQPPHWPAFGAVETKLRYDAPISVRADDGTYSSMSYDEAWDSRLQRRRRGPAQRLAIRVLAGLELRTVLGRAMQHGAQLRMGRDQSARRTGSPIVSSRSWTRNFATAA